MLDIETCMSTLAMVYWLSWLLGIGDVYCSTSMKQVVVCRRTERPPCSVYCTGAHSCRLNSVLRTDSTVVGHGWLHTETGTPLCYTTGISWHDYLENRAFSLLHCFGWNVQYGMNVVTVMVLREFMYF